MSIGIYKIENLINNKVYIGQSIHIEKRWQEHCQASSKSLIGKAIKKYGAELKDLEQRYKSVKTVAEKAELDNQFKNLKSSISAEGLTGKSRFDELGRSIKQIAEFAGVYNVVRNIAFQIPGQMVEAVKDVDSAMTDLYKVTDETSAKYNEFLTNAGTKSQELGRSMSSYIKQTSEWAKLGYSFDQATELSRVSSIYANVGEVSDDTAVSDMVTAMKAYNIKANDASKITDALNILGNNFSHMEYLPINFIVSYNCISAFPFALSYFVKTNLFEMKVLYEEFFLFALYPLKSSTLNLLFRLPDFLSLTFCLLV